MAKLVHQLGRAHGLVGNTGLDLTQAGELAFELLHLAADHGALVIDDLDLGVEFLRADIELDDLKQLGRLILGTEADEGHRVDGAARDDGVEERLRRLERLAFLGFDLQAHRAAGGLRSGHDVVIEVHGDDGLVGAIAHDLVDLDGLGATDGPEQAVERAGLALGVLARQHNHLAIEAVEFGHLDPHRVLNVKRLHLHKTSLFSVVMPAKGLEPLDSSTWTLARFLPVRGPAGSLGVLII